MILLGKFSPPYDEKKLVGEIGRSFIVKKRMEQVEQIIIFDY